MVAFPWWCRLPSWLALGLAFTVAGCSSFPDGGASSAPATDGLTAEALFERCLAAHGGDVHTWAREVRFAVDGEWNTLIQRIQPIVTDARYRVTSQERYITADRRYEVEWRGPSGVKRVVRTPETVEVSYNGVATNDEAVRQATAMTADAFQLFHLGPSFFAARGARFERIADAREGGVTYRRLRTTLRPGFGFSEEDHVVAWIHPETDRLYRVHFTVNGFPATRGAHVDTTYLAYRPAGQLWVPTLLNERLRGPLRLNVHRWWMTAAEVDGVPLTPP